jgi:dTDP-4-dehydrorhamnose reductase
MRILVTGSQGQVVTAMRERAPNSVKVVALGRPKLDLADPASIRDAFTAVDRPKPKRSWRLGSTARGLAWRRRAFGAPVIQFSPDYVFDGTLDHLTWRRPYRAARRLWPLQTRRRGGAVAGTNPRCMILRTLWVYSPFGTNLVKAMLRLGETRSEVRIVADQIGSPTSALDIADAVFDIAIGCSRCRSRRNTACSA